MASLSAVADFSEEKSSSEVDNWREFSLLPPSNGRITPVESDRLWFALGGCPLLLGKVDGGFVFRLLAFRRRYSNRATAAIRARTATPPITPPAMARPWTDESAAVDVGVATDGVSVGDVVRDREGSEVVGNIEEDGEMEDCNGVTTQDTSRPLVTLKMLDDMTPACA